MPDNDQNPRRIAILGAGPAGLATAWELVRSDPDAYDITVYDMSWRPGGKCASGRVDSPDRRIVQNGTHYIFGVFLNTLQFIKETYDELNPESNGVSDDHAGWGGIDELIPRRLVAMKQDAARHNFANWSFFLPCRGSDPFPTGPADDALEVPDIVHGIAEILEGYLKDSGVLGDKPFPGSTLVRPGQAGKAEAPNPDLFNEWRAVRSAVKDLAPAGNAAEPEALSDPGRAQRLRSAFKDFNKRLAFELEKSIPEPEPAEKDLDRVLEEAKRGAGQIRAVADLGQALLAGIAEDLLRDDGTIEELDKFELKDWLRANGASDESVDGPLLATWYDAVAAYEDGDPDRPSISTAAFLQSLVPAALKYRACFVYQMTGEVGENLSGPLYQALVNRGVKFRWLHRVAKLKLSADQTAVDEVSFEVPVRAATDAGDSSLPTYDELLAYDPSIEFALKNGKTRKAFPQRPKAPFAFMAPAVEGGLFFMPEAEGGSRRTIKRRQAAADGDEVYDDLVFALPHAVVPHVASELRAARSKWRDLAKVRTVETRSLRLWLKPGFDRLDWDAEEAATRPILAAFRPHFFVWEDSGQQLAVHTWEAGEQIPPQSIASVFAPNLGAVTAPSRGDVSYVESQTATAKEHASEFLRDAAGDLWPGIRAAGGAALSPEVFASWTGSQFATLDEALAEQYVIANVSPTERYPHAAPGAFEFRLDPFNTGFRNLYVAGDWTKLWPATGNMEQAVLSGRVAAGLIRGLSKEQMEQAFWNYPPFFR